MVYIVIFNGQKYGTETIHSRSWLEFIEQLNKIIQYYQQPPDLIYLRDGRSE